MCDDLNKSFCRQLNTSTNQTSKTEASYQNFTDVIKILKSVLKIKTIFYTLYIHTCLVYISFKNSRKTALILIRHTNGFTCIFGITINHSRMQLIYYGLQDMKIYICI